MWPVWVLVLVHSALERLARHEVALPKLSDSAGAQVGTVSATSSPFLTGIDRRQRELGRLAEVGLQLHRRARRR